MTNLAPKYLLIKVEKLILNILALIQTYVTFVLLARWQRTFNHYQPCFAGFLD